MSRTSETWRRGVRTSLADFLTRTLSNSYNSYVIGFAGTGGNVVYKM
jgi:hypothetical protein